MPSGVADETYVFGSFHLVPAQRLLLDDGKPLRLGSRALEILIALVESAGKALPNDQIIARAWPDTIVAEASLRVHIGALRKALRDGRAGKRFIVNIPGRGYAFVAPVTRAQSRPAAVSPDATAARHNLPARLTRVIGRSNIIAGLAAELAGHRLLTVVGRGGIGKTTVAVAVAERLGASYPDGVWFVGLAALPDPDLVPTALCAALGVAVSGTQPISELAAWLRSKQALIVLDGCDHVIDAAAALVEAILQAAPGVCVLATSREPLRAQGERLHRLAALELPSNSAGLSAVEALRYSAVQLFAERAMAGAAGFELADADVPAVLEICRRLDGLPLALELAAVQVEFLGIKGVARRLDDRLALVVKGRRTALPHHQTLRARSAATKQSSGRSGLLRCARNDNDFETRSTEPRDTSAARPKPTTVAGLRSRHRS
jgi:DNA-binding winged helix-turn-helix (wHTH) protein